MNSACEYTLGCPSEEAKGRRFWDAFLLPDEADAAKSALDALLSGKLPDEHVSTCAGKNGDRHLISWSYTALGNGCGGPGSSAAEKVVCAGVDVTERETAQRRIAHLARYPKEDPNPIIEINLANRISYSNPAANRAFADLAVRGIEHPALTGAAAVMADLRDGKDFHFVLETRVGDRYYHQTLLPFTLSEEKFLHVHMTDITERKRAEDALRRAEENYRHSLDDSPLGVRIVTAEGDTVYANGAILDISDCRSIEELKGTPLWKRYTPESYAEYQMRREKVSRGEPKPSEYEVSIVKNNGEIRHLQILNTEIFWNGLKQFQVIYRDITERKRAEAAIIRAKQEWERTFDAVPDLIALINADHCIVRVNKTMAARLGSTPQQLVGKHCYEVVHGLTAPPAYCPHAKLLTSEKEERMEVAEKRLRGIFDVSTTPLHDATGHLIGSIHVARDITERKWAEKRMQLLSQKIIAAREKERKQVSAVLHHDLGSLAVGISAHLDAIEEDVRAGKPGEALKWMKRTRKLFDQSVVRLKEVAVRLRPPELDVLGLRAALRQHFSQVARHGNVRIHFRDCRARKRVSGNAATVLFRIAQEAVTNAITHGHAKQVNVGLGASKKEVRLTVRDDGKGFDPSAQNARATSQIGLRVMREMTVSAGGAFEIVSKRGKGTTVRVSLPLKPA